MEQPELEWRARASYLSAKHDVRLIELYSMDLLCKLVRAKYEGEIPMPSDIWNDKHKVDRRSGEQILQDVLNSMDGR